MNEALVEAGIAYDKGEVPVGAVIVLDNKIISRGHNLTQTLQDPSAHAEMVVIREAAKKLESWRLVGACLYTTLEPCSMCAGAAFLSRLSRIIWGAPDIRHGANGSFVDLFAKKHPIHEVEIEGGLLAEESALLLRDFFKERRSARRCDCDAGKKAAQVGKRDNSAPYIG